MSEVRTNRIARMAALAAVIAITMTACNDQYQQQAEADQPAAQQGGNSELLAAGVGAAAGYLAGRATAPKQPTIVHAPSYGGRPVVIKQKVIVHKTIVRAPRSSYRPSRSFGGRSRRR